MSSGLEQNSLRIIQCQVDRKAAMFNQFWKMLYWNERSLEWGSWHHLRVSQMLGHTLSRWSQTPVLNIWYQQLLAQAYEIITPSGGATWGQKGAIAPLTFYFILILIY
ncbi:hypothetical protein NC652_036643 [Populus alba x Populus x berolinensis]|nr:hypothetical protein NC652_036643 [Populus alba x Populus x berolinensis]